MSHIVGHQLTKFMETFHFHRKLKLESDLPWCSDYAESIDDFNKSDKKPEPLLAVFIQIRMIFIKEPVNFMSGYGNQYKCLNNTFTLLFVNGFEKKKLSIVVGPLFSFKIGYQSILVKKVEVDNFREFWYHLF